MNKQILYILLILITGCARGLPIDGNRLNISDDSCDGDDEDCTNQEPEPQPVDPDLPNMEPSCGPTLNVPDALMDLVGPASDRWAKATGCPAKYSTEGIPVHTVSDLFDPEGNVIWGDTHVHTVNGKFDSCVSVTVSLRSRDLDQTFLHELGHCWGSTGGIDGKGHTSEGIMKAWHTPEEDGHINTDALELICANVPCLSFMPEI